MSLLVFCTCLQRCCSFIHLCVICDHFRGLMSLFQGHITCKNLTLLKFIQKILKAVLMKINFMSKTSLTNTKSKNSETSVVERLTKGQCPPKGTSLVSELRKVLKCRSYNDK